MERGKLLPIEGKGPTGIQYFQANLAFSAARVSNFTLILIQIALEILNIHTNSTASVMSSHMKETCHVSPATSIRNPTKNKQYHPEMM